MDMNAGNGGDDSRIRQSDENRGREDEAGSGATTEGLRSQSPAPLDRPISLFDGE